MTSTLNRTVQQWAHRVWHGVTRQEELLMKAGEEVGDGRDEGSSAIADGGQAECSLRQRFSFLAGFKSIYPLEEPIQ